MQQGASYIKNAEGFLKKLKVVGEIPKETIFVTIDVSGFIRVFQTKKAWKSFGKSTINSRTT